MIEKRPWGEFHILGDYEDCKIKRLIVFPFHRLSLQSHQHRQEEWIVVQGTGSAIVGNEIIELYPHKHITIPKTVKHRLINDHLSQNLELIEIQVGEYFGEDDITRYEDDYHRIS